MLSACQLLLMRRARDGAIGVAIAPIGTVVLLPDPDFRRRVFGCVSHVGLSCVARWVGRMDRVITNNAQRLGAYANVHYGQNLSRRLTERAAASPQKAAASTIGHGGS